MNAQPQILYPILFLSLLAAPLAFFLRAYLRIRFLPALGITLGAAVIGAFATMQHLRHGSSLIGRDPLDHHLVPVAGVLFFVFLIAFIVRMVRAWIFDDLTVEERLPNAEGIRAWLRGGNLVCAVVIPALGWYAFGYSAWALLLIVLLAIVARPTINSLGDGSASRVDSSLCQDRERIMKMLESGTIQPDEASELLSALAETSPGNHTDPPQPAISGKQRLAIGGSLLLLASFFMPWFNINLGQELNRMTSELNQQMGRSIGNIMPSNFPGSFSEGFRPTNLLPTLKTGELEVRGVDVGKGLGWFVLLCGAAAGILVGFPQALPDPKTRRLIAGIAFGLGTMILIYLVGSSLRHVTYGILLVVASYFCVGVSIFGRKGVNPATSVTH